MRILAFVSAFQLFAVSAFAFAVGDPVETLAPVNVRSEPLIASTTLLGTQAAGARGTVLEVGPTTVNGNVETTWYRVDWAGDPDGWTGHNNLQAVAPEPTYATPYLRLQWRDNSDNELGFRIERKVGEAGAWAEVATVGANVTSWVDEGLERGTLHTYRVRAWNNSPSGTPQYSGYTNEASRTTPAAAVPMPTDPDLLELEASPDEVTTLVIPAGGAVLVRVEKGEGR